MEEALENLKLVLSSPRERAPGTLTSYLQTGKTFLNWRQGDGPPTDMQLRRFFVYRREKGISERTLTKEFIQLRKLCLANKWDWPFIPDDRPVSEEEPYAPAFTPEEIVQLIYSYPKLTKSEAFYLAVSTTWGVRREELRRMVKRDFNETSVKIMTAKHGRRVEHLIPEQIKPVMMSYHPAVHNRDSFTYMFYRIMDKAGFPRRKGYGFHSIRRTLRTVLEWNLAEQRKPMSLVADYMGWSKTQKGIVYGGAAMLGVYAHQEIMSGDKFAIDRIIYNVHPFIDYWLVPADLPPAPEDEEPNVTSEVLQDSEALEGA